jgi:hypothetical protein
MSCRRHQPLQIQKQVGDGWRQRKMMNGQGNMRRLRRLWDGFSAYTGRPRGPRKLAARLAAVVLACGLCLLTSCMGPQGGGPELPRFSGSANADFIFRYFSDQVSHVEKPLTMEGPFYVACERPAVLKLAADQLRREMAVVVLIRYFSAQEEVRVKVGWAQDLKRLGYHQVVFLLAGHSKTIDGLPILPDPPAQAAVARQ